MEAEKRTRKAPDVRREEILDATIQLAIATSLNTVTIRDVAKAVGVGTGLVHHYFTSRRELIADAFESCCERVLHDYTRFSDVTPLQQLALFLTLQTPGEQRLWYDALSPSNRGDIEVLRDRARKLSLSYYDDVLAQVRQGIADGEFTCADPEGSAWRIILVLDGLVLDLSALSLPSEDRAEELASTMIDRELGLEDGRFLATIAEMRIRQNTIKPGPVP